jgi:CRP-like cAMP-binding protein
VCCAPGLHDREDRRHRLGCRAPARLAQHVDLVPFEKADRRVLRHRGRRHGGQLARGGARGDAARAARAGDYFGEIGLLEQIDRTATVTANCPSRVLRIGGEQFLDALTSAAASSAPLEGSRTRLARTHPTHGATRHARPEDLPV